MRDPRFDPLPSDPIDCIKRIARDLAWGALNEVWGTTFQAYLDDRNYVFTTYIQRNNHSLVDYQNRVWQDKAPSMKMLSILGYLADYSDTSYELTEKAFQLIEQPLASKIFISYMHSSSSVLALLIKHRLQSLNPAMDIFIDYTGLTIGNPLHWKARLQQAIQDRKWFICLIAPGSLDSLNIQDEIKWALEDAKKNIIPIWHNQLIPPNGETNQTPHKLSGANFSTQ